MTASSLSITAPLNRILVIGTTGSGKTTLAKQIAQKFGHTHIEADSLRFLPHWQVRQAEEFRAIISEHTAADSHWVIDGNYSVTRDITWPRAEMLIWLDYPFRINLWRLTRRTLKRITTKEDLWGTGNRETFRQQLQFNEDSLFYWLLKTYWKRKKDTPELLKQYPHLKVLHFTHPRQTEKWLSAESQVLRVPH